MINEFIAEPITATFHIGSEVVLTPSWREKNVILPNNKLFYILDGEIVIQTKNETLIGKKGDMMLIPAGVKHDFYLSKLCYAKKCWLHFDLFSSGTAFLDRYNFPFKIKIGENDFVRQTYHNIFKNAKNTSPTAKMAVSSGVLSLVSFYFSKCEYAEKDFTAKNEIDRAIIYIKKHYSENLTLHTIAKSANLSPNYFVRKFKDYTGYAPLQYVTVIKMERAKYLIEQSDESIGTIMEQLGYLDSSHFSKLFKKYCGYSPKRYREISGTRTKK
jgi:AraC-like DNA-binding protein